MIISATTTVHARLLSYHVLIFADRYKGVS